MWHECPTDDTVQNDDYVSLSVTNTNETCKNVLVQLYALIDFTKITPTSKLVVYDTSQETFEEIYDLYYCSLDSSYYSISFSRVTLPNTNQQTLPFSMTYLRLQRSSDTCKWSGANLSTVTGGYNHSFDYSDDSIGLYIPAHTQLRIYY